VLCQNLKGVRINKERVRIWSLGGEDDRGRIGLKGGARGGSTIEIDWIRGIEVLGIA